MKIRILAAVLPMAFLAPLTVNAQTADARSNSAATAQSPQARIDAALEVAAKAEIPAALVQSKIDEGRAKRVPQDRIATAVEARVSSLVRASDALRRGNIESRTSGDLSVTADALDAGVSEAALIRISRDAPPERRTVAVAVLTDLVRIGHASERALTRVSAALSSTAALANLNAEVASQLRLSGRQSTLDTNGIIRIQ